MIIPSFLTSSGRVQVKICGVTDGSEGALIAALGADAIGVNFWPKSKRYTPLEQAAPWLRGLANVVTRVGVFVDPDDSEIEAAFAAHAIDVAQLHGDEWPSILVRLAARGFPVLKALGIKDETELSRVESFPGSTVLLDAWAPVARGGTGVTLDWSIARTAVNRWPERKIILAGGLTPLNVAEAIRQVRPHAVDVASGVESGTPGRKDLAKVKAFIAAVRETADTN